MLTMGKYRYPNQVTFAKALEIAKISITKYDGKMSNKDVAEALGYKVTNPNAISGYIFRKFDDICAYGLMKRKRGYVKVTGIAVQALDPYDTRKAQEGKAKAIIQMPIVKEAFTKWKGVIPPETALPSKLVDLLGISWQEAQKSTESLRKLFSEVFPYLKATPKSMIEMSIGSGLGGEDKAMDIKQETGDMTVSARGKGFGFTKTLPFTQEGIQKLRQLIDFLENQIEEEETEETPKEEQDTD